MLCGGNYLETPRGQRGQGHCKARSIWHAIRKLQPLPLESTVIFGDYSHSTLLMISFVPQGFYQSDGEFRGDDRAVLPRLSGARSDPRAGSRSTADVLRFGWTGSLRLERRRVRKGA